MNPVVSSSHQMSIDFEPGLAERHQSALDCVRECAYTHRHPLKTLAANMDLSQSELSRKLGHNPDDPRRFTLDDLRQRRALSELANLAPQLAALIKQAGGKPA